MTSSVLVPATKASIRTVVFIRGDKTEAIKLAAENELRQLAYEKWEAAGKPESDGIEFWLAAERDYLETE